LILILGGIILPVATGKASYVHYRKPSGETGRYFAWGEKDREHKQRIIRDKGWEVTDIKYVTVSGRTVSKPKPVPIEKPVEEPKIVEPVTIKGKLQKFHLETQPKIETIKTFPSKPIIHWRYKDWQKAYFKKDISQKLKDVKAISKSFETGKLDIEPELSYRYEHPEHGWITTKGATLISKYYSPEKETDIKEAITSLESQLRKAKTMPSYITPKKTEKGWEFHVDIVKKQREEWKKLSPGIQTGKTLFVAFTHWPQTLWEAGTSPLTGKTAKQYQKELITWEHMTWQQAKKKDWGGLAISTITSPAVIEAVTLGALKGLSLVAKPIASRVLSATFKATTKTYGTMSKILPEEKILFKFKGKPVIQQFYKTKSGMYIKGMSKKMYQWTYKGYKWGHRLAPSGVKPLRETVTTKLFEHAKITQKLTYGEKIERAWLSPQAQKLAKKALQKKLTAPVKITFPTSEELFGGYYDKLGRFIQTGKEYTTVVGYTKIKTMPFSLKSRKLLVTYETIAKSKLPYAVAPEKTFGYTFKTIAEHMKAFNLSNIRTIKDISQFKGVTPLKGSPFKTVDVYGIMAGKEVAPSSGMFTMGMTKEKLAGFLYHYPSHFKIGVTGKIIVKEQPWGFAIKGTRPTKYGIQELLKKGGFTYADVIGTGEMHKVTGGLWVKGTKIGPMEAQAKLTQRAYTQWLRKQMWKRPFWTPDEAVQTLMFKPDVKVSVDVQRLITKATSSGFAKGRIGLVQRTQASVMIPDIAVYSEPLIYASIKIHAGVRNWNEIMKRQSIIFKQDSNIGIKSLLGMKQPVIMASELETRQLTTTKQKQILLSVERGKLKTVYAKPPDTWITPKKTKARTVFYPDVTTTIPPFVIPPFPFRLYGRGRGQVSGVWWMEKYRFRKAEEFNPLKAIVGQEKQIKAERRSISRKHISDKQISKMLWG
jgi:hypothetical protein